MAPNPFQPYTANQQLTIAYPEFPQNYTPAYSGALFEGTQPGFPGQLQSVSEQLAAGYGQNPLDFMKWQETFYKPIGAQPSPAPVAASSGVDANARLAAADAAAQQILDYDQMQIWEDPRTANNAAAYIRAMGGGGR